MISSDQIRREQAAAAERREQAAAQRSADAGRQLATLAGRVAGVLLMAGRMDAAPVPHEVLAANGAHGGPVDPPEPRPVQTATDRQGRPRRFNAGLPDLTPRASLSQADRMRWGGDPEASTLPPLSGAGRGW